MQLDIKKKDLQVTSIAVQQKPALNGRIYLCAKVGSARSIDKSVVNTSFIARNLTKCSFVALAPKNSKMAQSVQGAGTDVQIKGVRAKDFLMLAEERE